MIILNEKKFIENEIENNLVYERPSVTIGLLARYNSQLKNMSAKENIDYIVSYLEKNLQRFKEETWMPIINSYVKKAKRYPIIECDGIPIYKEEIDYILKLNSKILERLYFTLLCISKFYDYRNENNNGWVKLEDSKIYAMACITTLASDKDKRLYDLMNLGYISFSNKIDNLSIKVNQCEYDSEREPVLVVDDFRKLGYVWNNYKIPGKDRYVKCERCGILIRQGKTKKKKYCALCAKDVDREKSRERQRILRLSEK